jgi:hypothetical protein
MRNGELKEKKTGTVFQLPLLGNWILAFGQFECCFVEKGEGLQTSVGPLEKLREKSGYCGIFVLWGWLFGNCNLFVLQNHKSYN